MLALAHVVQRCRARSHKADELLDASVSGSRQEPEFQRLQAQYSCKASMHICCSIQPSKHWVTFSQRFA